MRPLLLFALGVLVGVVVTTSRRESDPFDEAPDIRSGLHADLDPVEVDGTRLEMCVTFRGDGARPRPWEACLFIRAYSPAGSPDFWAGPPLVTLSPNTADAFASQGARMCGCGGEPDEVLFSVRPNDLAALVQHDGRMIVAGRPLRASRASLDRLRSLLAVATDRTDGAW